MGFVVFFFLNPDCLLLVYLDHLHLKVIIDKNMVNINTAITVFSLLHLKKSFLPSLVLVEHLI